jgi:hypothetical protein
MNKEPDIMMNVVEMALQGNSFAERCNRERMKLAFALFDVEIAHSRFVVLDPADEDRERCLNDLKSALAKYWQIDNEVERYLRSGGRGHTVGTDARLDHPSTQRVPGSLLAELSSPTSRVVPMPRASHIETANRRKSRPGPASALLGAVGRMIGYVGRKVN